MRSSKTSDVSTLTCLIKEYARLAFKKIHPATIYHVINDKTFHACSFIRVCLFIRQFREYHRTFNFQSSSPLSYDNNDNGFHVFVSLLT